jgi:hypothetical protein
MPDRDAGRGRTCPFLMGQVADAKYLRIFRAQSFRCCPCGSQDLQIHGSRGTRSEESELTRITTRRSASALGSPAFHSGYFFSCARLPTTSQKSASDKSIPFLMFCLQWLWSDKSLVPEVGLEPTPSCEDRILSPVRLPSTWRWKQVGLTVKLALWQAVTSPLFASAIGAALG